MEGLGRLRCLSDALLLNELMPFLDGPSLARLAACSRAAYVYAAEPALWRTLALQKLLGAAESDTTSPACGGSGNAAADCSSACDDEDKPSSGTGPGLDFHPNGWRSTFAQLCTGREDLGTAAAPRIAVRGLYSDLLRKSWMCSAADIDPRWLTTDTCARRDASTLSVADFKREFEVPNRPVVITGVVNKWPAFGKWSAEYLTRVCGDARFDAAGFQLTAAQYFAYARAVEGRDDTPLYLFCKTFADRVPSLAADFSVPDYFGCEDLFSVLGTERPDYRWLIAGPKRSGSVFHLDPNATCAWNAVLTGRKKWVLFPPSCPPPGVHASADGSEVATATSGMEWLLDFYDASRKESRRITRAADAAAAARAAKAAKASSKAARSASAASAATMDAVVGAGASGGERLPTFAAGAGGDASASGVGKKRPRPAATSASTTEELGQTAGSIKRVPVRAGRGGAASGSSSSSSSGSSGSAASVPAAAPPGLTIRASGNVAASRGVRRRGAAASLVPSCAGPSCDASAGAATQSEEEAALAAAARAVVSECDPCDKPVEAVVGPGEVIFVPRGWWHLVVNSEDEVRARMM